MIKRELNIARSSEHRPRKHGTDRAPRWVPRPPADVRERNDVSNTPSSLVEPPGTIGNAGVVAPKRTNLGVAALVCGSLRPHGRLPVQRAPHVLVICKDLQPIIVKRAGVKV